MKQLINAALERIGYRLSRADTIPNLQRGVANLHSEVAKLQDQLLTAMRSSYVVPSVYGHRMHFDPLDVAMNLSSLNSAKPTGEAAFILRRLHAGQTALDIGANVGVMALVMAHAVGPAGRVYAFEPGPRAFQLLRMNIEANQYGHVIAENVAVSDSSGETELQVCKTGESDNRLSGVDANPDDYLRTRIRKIAIDDYLKGRPVDFIKIDVQGSEFAVLNGMRRTIAASPSLQIVLEYGPGWLEAAGVSPNDYFGLIDALGMRMFDLPDEGPEIPVTREWLAANIDGRIRPQTNLILRRSA